MNSDDAKKTKLEEYAELSKNSLVRVQYSCGGNATCIDEPEYIPIVTNNTDSEKTENEDEIKNS